MSKISQLPPLPAPITGEEMLPVVQEGGTYGATLGDFLGETVAAATAQAAQSAAYAAGFETPEYASQSAGNAATTPGQIFRLPLGTTPQTFNWYRRLSSGSELVSPLATTAALAAPGGAELIGRRTVTQLLADTSPARGAGAKWYADAFTYVEAASAATDHHLTTAGGVKLYVQPGEGGRADVRAFGCFLNGIADDTAALQRAFDSRLPLSAPKGRLLLSDTILLEAGADFIGAGGVARYDDAALQIAFTPVTKRGVFRWRTDPGVGVEGADYVFGCRLKGFCLRGFGPGAGMVLDLPHLYNGDLDFFCFAGVDGWIRLRRWMDSKVKGGVQGFRFFGVEFSGGGVYESDVTTTTEIDAYVSQGPIAYISTSRAVTDVKIKGTIESVDNALNMARGNVMHFDVYTENVPRTDSGSAWVVGKTGTAAAFETALHLNLRPGIGHSGGTLNNANLLDVDVARLVKVSGYTYLYHTLLKTTANTEKVLIEGLDTDNITAFSTPDGIADFSKIIMVGFTPRFMTQVPGGPFFIDGTAVLPSIELAEVDRSTVLPGQFFADKARHGKVYRRDKFGNFSAPIGALRVAGTSGWTVQGGRLTPGEVVQNSAVTPGEPGLWISTRFSKDVGNTYFLCSTTAGSPIVTNPAVGTFFLCEIGDYVTVSDGFDSATTQRRVIARAADLTSITLDSNATSTVSGTVNVITESHSLVPLAQQGHRTATADPTGVVTPFFVGEELLRTDNGTWYKSTGLMSADWKPIT